MNSKKEIAIEYLRFLEKGDMKNLLNLFSKNGIVESPVYGVMSAMLFYKELNNDTRNSELKLKGIFEEDDSNRLALYFNYKWLMKNNKQVVFDVVDIIEFNELNQIIKLKIIYDTTESRKMVDELNN